MASFLLVSSFVAQVTLIIFGLMDGLFYPRAHWHRVSGFSDYSVLAPSWLASHRLSATIIPFPKRSA